MKKRAIDVYDVAQLQKCNNMSSFWQFLVDLLILGVFFTPMQYAGFGLLLVVFLWEVGRIYIDIKRKHREEECCDDDDFTQL